MAFLIALLMLAAFVYLASVTWRALEALLQGAVGGTRLTWRLFRALALHSGRFARWVLRWADVLLLAASQRLHAAWWCWSYIWRRAYIAGRLRKGRRTGHFIR